MANPFPHPLILGHRGAPRELPENTLASLARAVELGADGVELDVRGTGDGVPVVVHDPSLERTMGVRGEVAAHPWPALQRLTGARLPSLEQVAAWAAASGAWLNVELKEAGVERATLAALSTAGVLERSFVSSFDPEVVQEVGRADARVLRFLLCEAWDAAAHEALTRCGAHGVCLSIGAADSLTLEVLRNDAVPVVVWTVNDPERIRELLRAGVAGVITDHPEMAGEAKGASR